MKIAQKNITAIERETVVIHNYAFPIKDVSITHIKVFGRHPADKSKLHIEHKLTLICYILTGKGKFVVDEKEFSVETADAIFIKPDQKYYIQGNLEYLVCRNPAYYREQHEQIAG